MKKFFIGIDVSKSTFDVAYHNGSVAIYLGSFKNNEKGFKETIVALKKVTRCRKNSWFFCFENTGIYSKLLFDFLYSLNYACREENPLHLSRSLGLKRAKQDEIDARDICTYAFEKRDTIKASEPLSKQLINLRKALSYRDLLVRKKVSIEVALKDQQAVMDEELYEFLMEGNEALVDLINQLIKKVDALIEKIIAEQEQTATNHYLAQTVIGVGPVISAYLIAYTNNYECFKDARAFACFCAIAPFPFQSGTSIKKNNKISYFGHKKIKSLLSNGVNAAIRHDKELKLYYQRKMAEGKAYGVVSNNIKNKLVGRVFAVIKRQTPFVALNKFASKPRKEVIHNYA